MFTNEKKIYLVLMHTKTLPSKIIKVFTHYRYSHVAISLDESCETLYSFGRRKFNSILNAGFSIEKKDGAFFEKFYETECVIYEKTVTNEQYDMLRYILEDMKSHIDIYKYDVLGIVPRYFGIPFTIKNRYVCSYFVAEIFERVGIHEFSMPPYFITPKDFGDLKNFTPIYNGRFNLYENKQLEIIHMESYAVKQFQVNR